MDFTQKRLYRGLRDLLGWPLSQLLHLRVSGEGHVPASGPALLIANHTSVLDPLILGVLIDRPIRFMAASFVFDLPLVGPLYRQLGAFPVDVTDGRGESGIRQAVRLLAEGELVGMFPEGLEHFLFPSCQRIIAPFQPGFAKILLRASPPVPVVPTAIAGFGPRFQLLIPPPLLAGLGHPFGHLGTRLSGYRENAVVIGQPSLALPREAEQDPEGALTLQYREAIALVYREALKRGPAQSLTA